MTRDKQSVIRTFLEKHVCATEEELAKEAGCVFSELGQLVRLMADVEVESFRPRLATLWRLRHDVVLAGSAWEAVKSGKPIAAKYIQTLANLGSGTCYDVAEELGLRLVCKTNHAKYPKHECAKKVAYILSHHPEFVEQCGREKVGGGRLYRLMEK